MGDILYGDFETRATIDIKKCGSDVYARHPFTQVMAFGYAFNDSNPMVNKIYAKPPAQVADHIANGGLMVAHNVGFEWAIWNFVWRREFPNELPPLKIEQMICTMGMAYAMALPGKLEKLAQALSLDVKKDMKGHRAMLSLSQPRNITYDHTTGEPVYWWHEPDDYADKFEKMYEYCATDLIVERLLYKKLIPLSQNEKKVFLLDHKINQRGVLIDVKAARNAIRLVEEEKERLDNKMFELTGGHVYSCSAVTQLVEWLGNHGVKTESIDKKNILDLLDYKECPKHVREVLLLRQEAAKSSTAKLTSMLNSICDDNRARSLLQYHGAGTGRWAGRRIQVQNLPRSRMKQDQIDEVMDLLGGEIGTADHS